MIKLNCYSKEEFLGVLAVKNGFFTIESKNKSFTTALQELSEQGIPVANIDSTVSIIFPKDSRYIFFLEKFLIKCGFRIIRVDTELITKLKQKVMTNDTSVSESSFNEIYGQLSVYEASLLLRTLDSLPN